MLVPYAREARGQRRGKEAITKFVKVCEADKKAQQKAKEQAKKDAKKQKEQAAIAKKKAAEQAKKDAEKAQKEKEKQKKKAAAEAEKAAKKAAKAEKASSKSGKKEKAPAKVEVVETTPMSKAELSKAILKKGQEVERLRMEKGKLQGEKGTSPAEINKVTRKLEASTQELQRLKALK